MRKMLPMILAGAVAAAGCYGPFRLTKKIHQWNGQVGEKWVNEAVFVAMVIVPVYTFASLGDAIIFNSIEFWTGNNPIASKPKVLKDGDKTSVVRYDQDNKQIRVDSFIKGRAVSTVFVEAGEDGAVARDADGKLLARSESSGEKIRVVDASGNILR